MQQRAAAIGAVRGSGDAPGIAEGALPQPLEPSGGEWTARRARPGQSGGTVRGGSIACPAGQRWGLWDTSAKHGLRGSVRAGAEVSRRTGDKWGGEGSKADPAAATRAKDEKPRERRAICC